MSGINNISKFVALNEYCLLEYEFSRDSSTVSMSGFTSNVGSRNGVRQYYNGLGSIGETNNAIEFNSIPITLGRDRWYTTNDSSNFRNQFTDSSTASVLSYEHDTLKVHIIAGYNFEDIAGFLLQVRTKDTSLNMLDLSNFTYKKQVYDASLRAYTDPSIAFNPADVTKFNSNAIFLANKFYDKYIEFKVPSVSVLGDDTTTNLGKLLKVKQASDVYINFSSINTISEAGEFLLNENISLQLPVKSAADSFNCFIAEATEGDCIKFYATWDGNIIGSHMGDIESGRIALYTSNNPNDNYESFSEMYGTDAAKWIINHEIYLWEHIGAETKLLTQKYMFTQDTNFSLPNYFRPVLKSADIDTSYSIQYICRLTNRMDGTQIIRKASFSSMDPQKYGLKFTRLYVENLIPYKVFNRIEAEKGNVQINSGVTQNKFVKVFYDTTNIALTTNNTVYTQGTGPLFLKKTDSVYKFKIQKYNETTFEKQNLDLSGAYNYGLLFVKDDGNFIEILPTYSTNMNLMLGEIEFKINTSDITTLLAQKNNEYSIVIKNPDGTSYTFYQGKYYAYANMDVVMTNYNNVSNLSALQSNIAQLESQLSRLTDEYNILLNNRR